jgi:hypothetical protein
MNLFLLKSSTGVTTDKVQLKKRDIPIDSLIGGLALS